MIAVANHLVRAVHMSVAFGAEGPDRHVTASFFIIFSSICSGIKKTVLSARLILVVTNFMRS